MRAQPLADSRPRSLVSYSYSISGVTYHTAQDITGLESQVKVERLVTGYQREVRPIESQRFDRGRRRLVGPAIGFFASGRALIVLPSHWKPAATTLLRTAFPRIQLCKRMRYALAGCIRRRFDRL